MTDQTRGWQDWMCHGYVPRPTPAPARLEHELWRVVKDTRSASCAVAAHPLGRELVVRVGEDLLWSEVYKPERDAELEPRASDEEQRWLALGWTRVTEETINAEW